MVGMVVEEDHLIRVTNSQFLFLGYCNEASPKLDREWTLSRVRLAKVRFRNQLPVQRLLLGPSPDHQASRKFPTPPRVLPMVPSAAKGAESEAKKPDRWIAVTSRCWSRADSNRWCIFDVISSRLL
jgi:hypothetical protein